MRWRAWSSRRSSKTVVAARRIEVARGLVGEQERRLQRQRPAEGHPLALAAGELVGEVVQPLREPHFHQEPAGVSSTCRGSRPAIRPGSMTFSSAVKSGRSWWNWKTKPIVRLRNAASRAPERPASDWPPISTVARVRPVERPEQVQQRRLARPRRADDRHHLPRLDREVDPPQHLDPPDAVLENVMLPGRIAGLEPRQVLANARRLLLEVGLEERLDHFPNQLSGGERGVALCRALVLEPPLLLADEPTGNLDPASGDNVFALLLDLQAHHRTTGILVTHNPRSLSAAPASNAWMAECYTRIEQEVRYGRKIPLGKLFEALGQAYGPLSTERAEQEFRALWKALDKQVGPTLKPPHAGPLEDDGFAMSWDSGRHHFEIEVAPDGTYGWFYMDRDSDSRYRGEDQPLGSVSPRMISQLRRTLSA